MSDTLLQINDQFTSMADLAKRATPDTAEGIAAVSGRDWKTWLLNEHGREAGGMYLFERQEGAQAFGNSAASKVSWHIPPCST